MNWRTATFTDFEQLSRMSYQIAHEVDDIFAVSQRVGEYHLLTDLTNQHYNPASALVLVNDAGGQIQAFTWARVETMLWSNDKMLMMRIVEVDPALSLRTRFRLLDEMMESWEIYCKQHSVPIICSTTIRAEQQGFLRLHQRRGYSIRGGWCYKRVIPK